MKPLLYVLALFPLLLVTSCSHCSNGFLRKGSACLPCSYDLIEAGTLEDVSNRKTFRLRIRLVDDVGNPISGEGFCPEVYYGGYKQGAQAFTEISRGVFEGQFPAHRTFWAAITLRTKAPKPFGRGMYRFSLVKDTDVYFTLKNWSAKSRTWNIAKPPACVSCDAVEKGVSDTNS